MLYILVTGNIKVQNGNDATIVAIKNCHPFTRATFKLNNEQVDTPDSLDLTMNLYNIQILQDLCTSIKEQNQEMLMVM